MEDLAAARVAAGLSVREVARRLGVSQGRIERLERGEPATVTLDLTARYAAIVGYQLAATVHPDGDAVRDRAHLALLARFRPRVSASLEWRVEVPVPRPGDPRSGDAVIGGADWDALVEAETRIGDVQLIERRSAAKARDLGTDRLIILVADTRHNRTVLARHPELRARFPIDTRTCLARLAAGRDPGGDALVIL